MLPSSASTPVLGMAESLIAELEESLVLSSVADIIIKCFSPDPL
ncbi:hypothetical protein [Hymenobacter sp. CRA2]|nr:hypothetical protein [Hymenobacter sp. CRA2]